MICQTDTRQLIRVPFVEGGADLKGWDCYGLLVWTQKHLFGRELPPLEEKRPNVKDRRLIEALCKSQTEHHWEVLESRSERDPPLKFGPERPGDAVSMYVEGTESHFGVIIKPGLMLHTRAEAGTLISQYQRDRYWTPKIAATYRVRSSVPTTQFASGT